MAAFHVFVEGPVDRSPAGVERLAAAIAQHYGLPVAELRARLARGRFRVKGNCDRETAELYARELTKLGARCTIVASEAGPGTIDDSEAAARTSSPALSRTTTPLAGVAAPARPSKSGMQSGLAAAFNADPSASASLGALEDGGMLKLSSVDGAEEAPAPPPAASFAPPPAAPAAKPAKPAAAPVDMFAPPDAEAAAFKVELADDELERAAKKRASVPPVNEPPPAPAEPPTSAPASRPSLQQVAVAAAPPTGLADPKVRFALGVLIAIVVGFLPAHLIAHSREKAAYADIDRTVVKTQHDADTQDAYDALDAFRARELALKYDARQSAAMLAMVVWAIAGAGIAFVWFKRIRWPQAEL